MPDFLPSLERSRCAVVRPRAVRCSALRARIALLAALALPLPAAAAILEFSDPVIAPLGVPTRDVGTAEAPRELPAMFKVRVALPAFVGPEVKLDLVSVGPGGEPIDGAGDLPGLPQSAFRGADGLVLRRLSALPTDEGAHWYESGTVVAIADLRAARAYMRTGAENGPGQCVRCDGAALGVPAEAREILSGDAIRAIYPDELVARLAPIYGAEALRSGEPVLPSVRWEMSPGPRPEPARNASGGAGDVVPGTLLHSGEFTHGALDLAVRGRGLDFAFRRSYRNQTVGAGPLGPGWDFGYRLRLRRLPDGDVELYDGTGRRETFIRQSDGSLQSPPGLFAVLLETNQTFLLLDPSHASARFDRWGRLTALADPVKDRATTGSGLEFHYDAASRLVRIVDDLGRAADLDYDDDGRLTTLSGFDGRTVRYEYDAAGRLERVISPAITIGQATFPSGLATEYDYAEVDPSGDATALAATLAQRDNLLAVRDPRGETPLEVTFTDADGDGRADEATAESWGGHPLAITYDFASHAATVTDRRGFARSYQHNGVGHLLRYEDPTGAATTWVVDGEGLVTRATAPLGRVTGLVYDTSGARRARGNLLSASITADGRGDNGSAHVLTTSYEYDAYSNQPTRITDPRGAVTTIARNALGLATAITEAFGAPGAGTTTTAYNDFGQPTEVVDPNGHVTTYGYFATGPARGYLQRSTVDPGDLDLTTTYDRDERGNVLAVTDPRGVRHEAVYNELDWLVESTQAASAATDGSGAPALGFVTTYLHDANGNLLEARLPAGDGGDTGAGFTAVQRDYGVLNEVLEERREIAPGDFATVGFDYDEAFHRIRITHPEGNVEEWQYNSRNLPQIHRRGLGTGALPAPLQTETLYNADGDEVGTIDGRGLAWPRVLDGFGRPFRSSNPLDEGSETRYDSGGLPAEIRHRAGETILARSLTEYDLRGRPIARTTYLWETEGNDPRLPDDPAGALALRTELAWSPGSELLRVTDPLLRVTSAEYDAAGRRTAVEDPAGNRTEWQFDRAGNPRERRLEEKTPGGEVVALVATATFDALGRTTGVTDALGNTSQTSYDARGNPVLAIDPAGALTVTTWDGLGRLRERVRPEGILERFEYDRSSRLVAHSDALLQTTTYTYDAANRRTTTTYPDGTQRLFAAYDGNDNLLAWTDANGSAMTQLYDGANRMRGRSIARGGGVLGVEIEAFDYDGLSRLTRAQGGSVMASFTYDSLSRATSETQGGRKTTYLRDDAGNALGMLYPSGLAVLREFDALDRTRSIGGAGAPDAIAGFRYRGASRLAGRDLGPHISGTTAFDSAGRPTFSGTASPLAALLSEQTSFSPRGLASATTRWDLDGAGTIYRHDDAGRLRLTETAPRAATAVANNSTPPPSSLELTTEGFAFDYTPAEHMTRQAEKRAGILAANSPLPADGSGRNRPASVHGKALTWDANGNLTAKGAVHYAYDFRNRLVRVTEDGVGELASYDYDALNRRLSRTVAGEEHQTVWSGWQAIEEYGGNGLAARRVYGPGLDEIVRSEVDLDDDGTLETTQRPIYDRIGHLVVLANEQGKPVERYTYTPFGPQKTTADLTPPQLTQIRRSEFGEVHIEWSEGLSGEALRRSLAAGATQPGATMTVDDQPLSVNWDEPQPEGLAAPLAPDHGTLAPAPGSRTGVASAASAVPLAPAPGSGPGLAPLTSASGDTPGLAPFDGEPGTQATLTWLEVPGREPGRTLALTLPAGTPTGATVSLTLHPSGIQDDFANPLAAPVTQTFTWTTGAAVLRDDTPPEIERIVARFDGVEILFSEPVQSATLPGAITVDGQSLAWQPAGSDYLYRAAMTLPPGPHQLQVTTALQDLAGTPPTATRNFPFTIQGGASGSGASGGIGTIAYEKPDPNEIETTAAQNPYGFQGLPRDPETGFLYVRNRYYDPEIARFITPDPLGFIDGPSEYAFAGNSPANSGDPLGLYEADFHYGFTEYLARLAGFKRGAAHALASLAESPDQDERSPVASGARIYPLLRPFVLKQYEIEGALRLRDWHFPLSLVRVDEFAFEVRVVPGSAEARSWTEDATRLGDFALFGQGLHTLQDSYSHQGVGFWEYTRGGEYVQYGHPNARGGGFEHVADQTYLDPPTAREAARASFAAMLEYRRNTEGLREDQVEVLWTAFDAASAVIERFILASTVDDKLAWFDAHGIQFDDGLAGDLSLPTLAEIARRRARFRELQRKGGGIRQ